MILIIKHIEIEGPGSIEEFFNNTGQRLKVINLGSWQKLPLTLQDIEAVIILGGPMNVYEEEKFPFLKEEDDFLKKALLAKLPILGICLGAQLLSKASNAKVRKAENKEVGWAKVSLTSEGRIDPLFENLDSVINVFQWHEDTFDVPVKGVLLAENKACCNQAFRVNDNAYGLQFHVEVTPEIIESWINSYARRDKTEDMYKTMLIEAQSRQEEYKRQAFLLYRNFSRIISPNYAY